MGQRGISLHRGFLFLMSKEQLLFTIHSRYSLLELSSFGLKVTVLTGATTADKNLSCCKQTVY